MKKLFIFFEYIPHIYSLTIPNSSLYQSNELITNEIDLIEKLSKKNSVKKITIFI